jgi:hypothetical protein
VRRELLSFWDSLSFGKWIESAKITLSSFGGRLKVGPKYLGLDKEGNRDKCSSDTHRNGELLLQSVEV